MYFLLIRKITDDIYVRRAPVTPKKIGEIERTMKIKILCQRQNLFKKYLQKKMNTIEQIYITSEEGTDDSKANDRNCKKLKNEANIIKNLHIISASFFETSYIKV